MKRASFQYQDWTSNLKPQKKIWGPMILMNSTKNEASPQYLCNTKAPQENRIPTHIPAESQQNASKWDE